MTQVRRIALIGGSGFVGHELVHALTRRGWRVTVACRRPHRARELLIHQTRIVAADVTTGKGLDEAMRDAEAVVYLVGLLYEKGRQTFRAAHVDGVARALEAARKAGVQRFLHMSALGAGRVPESRYATTKAEGEALVRDSGLDWTIFRPSAIYGARDRFLNRFKALARRLPVVPLIGGGTRFQPIWVRDVARAFALAVDDAHAIGATIELGGPERLTLREIVALMLDELGWRRRLVDVPPALARLIAALGELAPIPPITRDQLALLAHDNVIDGDPYPPRYGEPARLAEVLPTFLHGHQAEILQRWFEDSRSHYRNMRLGSKERA